jgi:hypothetical protein
VSRSRCNLESASLSPSTTRGSTPSGSVVGSFASTPAPMGSDRVRRRPEKDRGGSIKEAFLLAGHSDGAEPRGAPMCVLTQWSARFEASLSETFHPRSAAEENRSEANRGNAERQQGTDRGINRGQGGALRSSGEGGRLILTEVQVRTARSGERTRERDDPGAAPAGRAGPGSPELRVTDSERARPGGWIAYKTRRGPPGAPSDHPQPARS